MTKFRLLLLFAGLLLPSVAMACLWDYDTLRMERSRFPNTLELITGKFLRHSKEFYLWRIRDRLDKLKEYPENLAWYDDLAVAYDKTGQHQKAIETMLDKDHKTPGLYETAANLGTFYIHSGQLEEGLKHIDRALKINPDAHFGREKYQKLLVEYVLSHRQNGITPLPLAGAERSLSSHDEDRNFLVFLMRGKVEGTRESERKDAIKGLLGMMKFGNHESPVLLEALGNVLSEYQFQFDDRSEDAKQLAARAYLKASYTVSEEEARKGYRELANRVLVYQARKPSTHKSFPLEELEAGFRQELGEAKEWYENLQQSEAAWIRDGLDPEKEFDRLYDQEPRLSPSPDDPVTAWSDIFVYAIRRACSLALLGLVMFILKQRMQSRSNPMKDNPAINISNKL
jgi:tetratricopeptide (TPR) repeat protein